MDCKIRKFDDAKLLGIVLKKYFQLFAERLRFSQYQVARQYESRNLQGNEHEREGKDTAGRKGHSSNYAGVMQTIVMRFELPVRTAVGLKISAPCITAFKSQMIRKGTENGRGNVIPPSESVGFLHLVSCM